MRKKRSEEKKREGDRLDEDKRGDERRGQGKHTVLCYSWKVRNEGDR